MSEMWPTSNGKLYTY